MMNIIRKPLLLTLFYALLQIVCGAGAMVVTGLLDIDSSDTSVPVLVIALVLSNVFALLIASCMKMPQWETLCSGTWHKASTYVLFAFFSIFVLNVLSEAVDLTNMVETQMMKMFHNPLGIIVITVVGPVCEELGFRKSMIDWMRLNGATASVAILVPGLLFGLIHINPAQVPFAAAMGIVLGWIYWRTRNIWLCSLIHICNNSTAALQGLLLGDEATTFRLTDWLGGWHIALAAILLSLAFMYLCYRHITSEDECYGIKKEMY